MKMRRNTPGSYWKFLLAVIVVITAASMLLPRNLIQVDVDDQALTVVCAAGNRLRTEERMRVTVPLKEIEEISLIDTAVQGTHVSGYTGREWIGAVFDAGVWNAEAYGGDYHLVIQENARKSISIQKTDGSYVIFNYESTDSTQSLYRALLDYLEK